MRIAEPNDTNHNSEKKLWKIVAKDAQYAREFGCLCAADLECKIVD